MLRRIIIWTGLLLATSMSAQNTLIPSVSNYHLTWTTINPAFTGFRDAISLSTLYRSKLYGSVGPQDMQVNVHSPVGNSKVALGGMVAYNLTPPDQSMYSLMGTYAYRMYVGSGRLSLGLSAGLYGVNSNTGGIDVRDPGDPSFPYDVYKRWFPNFGVGILYYSEQYFVGLSVPELMAIPGPDQGLSANPKDYRVILTGAYHFKISTQFSLKPSAYIDYSTASTSFKVSLTAGLLRNRVYVGAVYDHPNYIVALLNFQVNPQWLVGYAYTMGTGMVRTALGGSHEIVLRWELRPVVKTYDEDPFYF